MNTMKHAQFIRLVRFSADKPSALLILLSKKIVQIDNFQNDFLMVSEQLDNICNNELTLRRSKSTRIRYDHEFRLYILISALESINEEKRFGSLGVAENTN